ncbi:MAG: hypothetical protein KatS3mg087_0668 [Patescibacteria group bacterium]|nr:MAG: hypothetical protein KatS3mg087_0668 [Patescibacteria group bacterium]
MKNLFRLFLFSLVSIFALDYLVPGLYIIPSYQNYFILATVFMFLRVIAIPILAIIFFPINFLTGGFLKVLLLIGGVYLLALYLPTVRLEDWFFSGASYQLPYFTDVKFQIPSIHFKLLENVILIAIIHTAFMSFLTWLSSD